MTNKIVKTFIAGLMAVASVSIAQAQTNVRLTGSTAYRLNTHNAILHSYDASPAVQYGFTGASFTGAAQAIFVGNIGGQPVTTKTSWSGSEGGIQTVAGSVAIAFLPNSTTVSAGGGTGGATVATSGNGGDVAVPDVAMSDTFQSSSAFFGLYQGTTYPTLTESPNSPVGIVPFKFLGSANTPASLTNITLQQAKALFGSGKLPLAFFTGNAADESTTIVATGRDPDSGTRGTASSEWLGNPQAFVRHYQPRDSGGNLVINPGTPIVSFVPWPASVINGIPVPLFNGGYNSGGNLAKMMTNTTPAGFSIVSYAGTNDADPNLLLGAKELSYNGVTLGTPGGGNYNNATALTEGKYTFWGYEHLYYRSGTPSPVVSVANTIANQLKTVDAAVFLSSMKVDRSTDGAVVFPSYSVPTPP